MDIDRKFVIQFCITFLPFLLVLSLVTALIFYLERKATITLVQTQDTSRIQLSLKVIETKLHSLEADTLFLANQQYFRQWIASGSKGTKESAIKDFALFSNRYPDYDQIRFLNADGVEAIRIERRQASAKAIPEDQLQDKSSRYYLNAIDDLKQGELYISAFDLNVEHGEVEIPYKPIIRIGTPIYNHADEYTGSLILNYLGAQLLQDLQSLNMPGDRQLWLLNNEGYWLLGPSPQQEWGFMWSEQSTQNLPTHYPNLWSELTTATDTKTIQTERGYFSITPINTRNFLPNANNLRLYAVAFTPKHYIDNQISLFGSNLLLLYGLITVIILVSCWIITRKETARLNSEQQLQTSEKQYRNLLEGAPDAIVIIDQQGLIQLVNDKTLDMFGYKQEELIQQSVDILLPERFRERHLHHRQTYIQQPTVRPMGESSELFARCKDGRELPVEISLSPLIQNGKMLVTAIIRDITVRKERNNQIKQLNYHLINRSTELEAINKELEAFSYSVSHDLRAPLRAIDGFSQTLLKNYAEQLDDKGRDRLERIRAAAKRMGRLIDDLLNLSRISRTEVVKEPLDISKLALEVITELESQNPLRKVSIEIQPELYALADSGLLRVVMTNLISNAWKFTSRMDQPLIKVYGLEQNSQVTYVVEDNGAGFNMSYANKLFGAFQRLHDSDEFPGTGIGLATVQRVIHKHGGKIWAEAEEGKGAKFYFTLSQE